MAASTGIFSVLMGLRGINRKDVVLYWNTCQVVQPRCFVHLERNLLILGKKSRFYQTFHPS